MSFIIMLVVGVMFLGLVLRLVGGMLKIMLVVVILMLLAGGSYMGSTGTSPFTSDTNSTSL